MIPAGLFWDLFLSRTLADFYKEGVVQGRLFLCLAVLALIVWTGTGIAQQSKVPPEVWEKAQTEGVVRVIVGLNVPWQPEGKLSQQAVLAQRQAISTAQDALLAELVGTNHRVTRRLKLGPDIGLEVGPDALAVLEHSARVIRITEDRVAEPLLQQSVPLIEGDRAWAGSRISGSHLETPLLGLENLLKKTA